MAVLAAYGLLTVVMTWPLVLNLGAAIPGDGFDGWQNYWNQWWIKVALVDQVRNPLVTDLLYYPTGVGLYFHTLNPFNGLLTLPIQLTAGLIPAYNAIVFFSWIMGGYGVFLLTFWMLAQRRKIEDLRTTISGQGAPARSGSTVGPISDLRSLLSFLSAFVAGAIFTFSPFHMAHLLGHMQVMSFQWIAFYILYLLRATAAIRSGRPWLRNSLMAGLFLVFTGLCDWYFVFYLLIFTGLLLLWLFVDACISWIREIRRGDSALHAMVRNTWRFIRLLAPPVIAGTIFLIVLSPWLVPMVRQSVAYSFMIRPQSDLYILSAGVMDFLVPNRLHTLFRPQSFEWVGNQIAPVSEKTISIGYMVLALAVVGLLARPRRSAFWGVTALVFFGLALGPVVHFADITWADIPTSEDVTWHTTPLGVLNYFLPVARLTRSVSRYALMVQLSMAVLAGIGLATLLRHLPTTRAVIVAATAVLAIILAEFWVAPYPLSRPDTPAYYGELAAGDGAILNLPMNYDRPGYLLYQTVHQRPLTVAYISREDPRTLTERVPVLQHFRHLGPDILDVDVGAVGQTVLHDAGVEIVVLDRYKMPGGDEREVTTALAQKIFAGQAPVYEDDRITVYKVDEPDEPAPYPMLGPENWGPFANTGNGVSGRMLSNLPSELIFRHRLDGTSLRIRYRTVPGVSANVALSSSASANGDVGRINLPSAPEGKEVVVDLDALGVASGVDSTTLVLSATASDGFWIEELELIGQQ